MARREVAGGLLLAAASGILYGTITVMAKWVDAAPFAKGFLSTLAAALVVAPFLWRLRVPRRDWLRVAAMGFFGAALAPALILHGLEGANASDAGMLLTLELVATAILAFGFLRERVSDRSASGLACLLGAGVAIALASGREGESQWWGLLLVALACLSWGVDNVVSAALVDRYRPGPLVAAKTLVGTVLLGLAWAVVGGSAPAGEDAAIGWLALAGMGSLGLSAGALCFYRALDRIGAARTSAINIPLSAFCAAVGGVVLLGEAFGWLHGVAAALILAGGALLWEKRTVPSAAKSP